MAEEISVNAYAGSEEAPWHSVSSTQAVESSSIDQLSPQDDDEEPSKDSIMAGKSLEETEDKSAEAKTIFVGNLSRELDSDDLKTLFQRYGKIVEFIRHEKKKTKEDILYSPFAIITMEKKSEVERAIQELNGLFLDGKAIVVQKAVSKEAKRAAGLPSWRDGQSKTETHRPRKRALEEQFRCDDCNIDLYSKVRFDSHMAGKKHANKVGKGNNSSTLSDTESGSNLRCDICNINFSTFSRTDYGAKSRLDGHLAGKKHAKMVSNLDGAR